MALSHCTVGRKSRGQLLAVEHYASWHPKMTIIRVGEMKGKPGKSTKGLGKSSLLPAKIQGTFSFPFYSISEIRARRASARKSLIAQKDRVSARTE